MDDVPSKQLNEDITGHLLEFAIFLAAFISEAASLVRKRLRLKTQSEIEAVELARFPVEEHRPVARPWPSV